VINDKKSLVKIVAVAACLGVVGFMLFIRPNLGSARPATPPPPAKTATPESIQAAASGIRRMSAQQLKQKIAVIAQQAGVRLKPTPLVKPQGAANAPELAATITVVGPRGKVSAFFSRFDSGVRFDGEQFHGKGQIYQVVSFTFTATGGIIVLRVPVSGF
jgi:hypothetical protein